MLHILEVEMNRFAIAALAAAVALAPMTAAEPERVSGANYPQAQKFTSEFVRTLVKEVSVSPQWVGKTDVFWYIVNSPQGFKYWKVDPERKTKEPLFDQVKMAAQLSISLKKPIDADKLQFLR